MSDNASTASDLDESMSSSSSTEPVLFSSSSDDENSVANAMLSGSESPSSLSSDDDFNGFKIKVNKHWLSSGLGSTLSRTFEWPCAPGTKISNVAIAGTFTGWKPIILKSDVARWIHVVTFDKRERGVYMYKTILNGTDWVLDPHIPQCRDAHGNINNVVEVLGKSMHPHDTSFVKFINPRKPYPKLTKWDYIVCDGCKRIRVTPFYHCQTCRQFDYCEPCYETRHQTHLFNMENPSEVACWVCATLAQRCLEKTGLTPNPQPFETLLHDVIGILKQNGETHWQHKFSTRIETIQKTMSYPHQRAFAYLQMLNDFVKAIHKSVVW